MREIRDSARRTGRPVPIEMSYKVGHKDFRPRWSGSGTRSPTRSCTGATAVEGAKVLNHDAGQGHAPALLWLRSQVSDEFVRIAGRNAEGVFAAFPWDPTRTIVRLDRFRKAYRKRFPVEVETYAAHAYDGMNLLLWTIQGPVSTAPRSAT